MREKRRVSKGYHLSRLDMITEQTPRNIEYQIAKDKLNISSTPNMGNGS